MKLIARLQKDTGQGNCFHTLNVVADHGYGWDKVAQVWGILEKLTDAKWHADFGQFGICIWNGGLQFLWADCVVIDYLPQLTEKAIRTN